MSSKKASSKKVNKTDGHYDKIISRMERDIAKLKAKNKALTDALKETELHLNSISKDKTIYEIFQEVLDNTEINVKKKCPKCHTDGMKVINLGSIKIISCSCGYRNRLSEPGSG